MENRALGKGLSALIPEKVKTAQGAEFIGCEEITANMLQPRQMFNDEKQEELIASIKEKGVLQPLLVRRKGSGYELIAGERRLRAAKVLQMEKVPVLIKDVSDQEALVLALIENIQREELNPLEEAEGFQRLMEDFDYTQDDVAQSVGMNRSTVANLLRLLKLPEEIKKSLQSGVLSMGHARALLGVDDDQKQRALHDQLLRKELSVRELESMIRLGAAHTRRPKKNGLSPRKDAHIIALEEELQRKLGTKVRIQSKKKRGAIVIEYYSLDDLERILGTFK